MSVVSIDRCRISKITGSREREVTHEFLRLESHYLFEHHFCLVRRPNEKGHVERLLDFARANILVPVPVTDDLARLNEQLTAGSGLSNVGSLPIRESQSGCPAYHSPKRDGSLLRLSARFCVSETVALMGRLPGLLREATSLPSQIARAYPLMEMPEAFRKRGGLLGLPRTADLMELRRYSDGSVRDR